MTVNFKGLLLQDDIDNDKKCIRTRIWNLFEYPESSRSAQVHYVTMLRTGLYKKSGFGHHEFLLF